jgi:peptidoglycan/LPS O-acetylase OafA/YrhL
MASTERKRRTAGLDGLRALAALSVVCMHVWLYGLPDPDRPTRSGVLEYVAFELRLGLVFFFVLSGYLLYRAFAAAALGGDSPVDVARYARRRLARIVPAYYLAIAGAFVLLWGARGEPGVRLPEESGLPLFLVFGQNYSSETFMTLNPVTWTLAVEAAFYIALPLIGLVAWRFARGSVRRQVVLLSSLVAGGLAYSAVDYYAGWDAIAGKGLPAYLPHFAAGMFVALWAERRRARREPVLSPFATVALVIGGFAVAAGDAVWHALARTPADDPLMSILGDVPAAAGFAAVVAAVVLGRGPAVAWTSARPLAWVGLVSYGIYLWHVPVILFARSNGFLPSGFLPALAAVLPVVLAVSAASWYLVERPLMERADRPRRRRGRGATKSGGQPQLEAHAAP